MLTMAEDLKRRIWRIADRYSALADRERRLPFPNYSKIAAAERDAEALNEAVRLLGLEVKHG